MPEKAAENISEAEVELWREVLVDLAADPTQIPGWDTLDTEKRLEAVMTFAIQHVREEREESYSQATVDTVEESLRDAIRTCFDSMT